MNYSVGYPAQCWFWRLCNLSTWPITPWLLPYFLSVTVNDLSPESLAVQLCTNMMYTVVSTLPFNTHGMSTGFIGQVSC